jgi:hypothetical protein
MLLVPMITGINEIAIDISKKVTNKNNLVKNMIMERRSKTTIICGAYLRTFLLVKSFFMWRNGVDNASYCFGLHCGGFAARPGH